MKKLLLLALVGAMALFTLAACNTQNLADIQTSSGGEIVVTASEVGTVENTVELADEPAQTAEGTYETLTISYTDPEGYTKTEEVGGEVTYTLDGYEVGKIVYMPKTVEMQAMNEFYNALAADAAELQVYAQEFADELADDFQATKTTVNGQDALLITGTVGGDASDNVGAEAMCLVMPVGDQLVVIRGLADQSTAEQIKADLNAFAESVQGQVADIISSVPMNANPSGSAPA